MKLFGVTGDKRWRTSRRSHISHLAHHRSSHISLPPVPAPKFWQLFLNPGALPLSFTQEINYFIKSKSNDSSKRHDFIARIDIDLHPFAQVDTFNELLVDFNRRNAFRARDEAPYLHPRILSYIGAASKKFWTNGQLDGAKDRDYLYQFWKASTSANTRIGVSIKNGTAGGPPSLMTAPDTANTSTSGTAMAAWTGTTTSELVRF
ncbi:MAG: hypothetical protein Q9178_007174 [Gyalolechia marmorata]